jgi:hypothetical protein
MLPDAIVGITDASMMRSLSTPRTRNWGSTTAMSSLPMPAVPQKWNEVSAFARM